MASRRKRCRFCGVLFSPNPRLADRQYACGSDKCQKERHRRNCSAWNDEHRDQFEDRYEVTRIWLTDHPGYLAGYRRSHPAAAEEHRRAERDRLRRRRAAALDIQDSIRLQALCGEGLKVPQLLSDIQDSIWRQLFVPLALSARYRSLDMRDSMAPPLLPLYSAGKEIWQWAKRERERAGV